MQDDYSAYQIDNPTRLSQRYFGITYIDKPYVVICGIIAVTMFLVVNQLAGFSTLIIGAVFFYKFHNSGRLYYELIRKGKRRRIRRNGGIIWEKPEGSSPKRRLELFRKQRAAVIPIRQTVLGKYGFSMNHNKRSNTDSIVVIGDGSDDAAAPIWRQHAMIEQKTHALLRIASRPDVAVGVSLLFRKEPFNIHKLVNDQMGVYHEIDETDDPSAQPENEPGLIHPEIAIPVGLEKSWEELSDEEKCDYRLWLDLGEMNNLAAEEGVDVTMAAVITIKRYGILKTLSRLSSGSKSGGQKKKKWRRLIPSGKNASKAISLNFRRLPIVDIAETCVESLRACGVHNPRVLDDAAKLASFNRGIWDIGSMDEFYNDQDSGKLDGFSHLPRKLIKVTDTTATFDTTTHSVIQVTGLPSPNFPSFMRMFHALDSKYLSIALVGETIDSTGDYIALDRLAAISEAGSEWMPSGLKTQDAMENLKKRQKEVHKTKYLYLYNLLIGVAHPSDEADRVDNDVHEIISTTEGIMNAKAKVIVGEDRQVDAVYSVRGAMNML